MCKEIESIYKVQMYGVHMISIVAARISILKFRRDMLNFPYYWKQ